MSSNWGKNIELSIFGESHGKAIGINIGNLPSGISIDEEEIKKEMARRAPGKNKLSTARKEGDEVEILSGLLDGMTTGAPLCGIIYNSDQHSKDYSILKTNMRPGHSDYPAYEKYHGLNDVRGGGHFSGRLTAPIVFAGAVAKQVLKQTYGIEIVSHIQSVYDQKDQSFPHPIPQELMDDLRSQEYPVINHEIYMKMAERVDEARNRLDSVGGKVECAIVGVQAGIGEPFFRSIESVMSSLLFSIPAVKGVEFGDGFDLSAMHGSEANDCYYYDKKGKIQTTSNHNGGILGGISNGQEITFTVAFKPTPSIALKQQTINIETKENVELEIKGRHDPCIVFRAVAVVEAMAAIGILEMVN